MSLFFDGENLFDFINIFDVLLGGGLDEVFFVWRSVLFKERRKIVESDVVIKRRNSDVDF